MKIKIQKIKIIDLDEPVVLYLLRHLSYGSRGGLWPAVCHIRKHKITDAVAYLASNDADQHIGILIVYQVLGHRNNPINMIQMFVDRVYRCCGVATILIHSAKKDYRSLYGCYNEDAERLYSKYGIKPSNEYTWNIPGRNREHTLMDIMSTYANALDKQAG